MVGPDQKLRDRVLNADPTPMVLLLLLFAGLVIVFVAALLQVPSSPIQAGLVAVLVAAAAMVLAGILGLLFGIPRAYTSEVSGAGAVEAAKAEIARGYKANTNLEQVSDWLTKILIGATLTQLGAVPGLVQQLVDYLDDAFGAGPAAAALVLGIVGVYAGGGFLVGYLWARLWLGRALRLADDGSTPQAPIPPNPAGRVATELALDEDIRARLQR
jgi:hypothetical protein